MSELIITRNIWGLYDATLWYGGQDKLYMPDMARDQATLLDALGRARGYRVEWRERHGYAPGVSLVEVEV